MPAVWPIRLNPPFPIRNSYNNLVISFGDGYEQRGDKNLDYVHADGQGNVTAHGARWSYDISMTAIEQANGDSTKIVNQLYQFFTARMGNTEAFYFYNPLETGGSIDLTGVSTVGRYLVRFLEPDVNLSNIFMHLHNASLRVIEVRS